MIKKLTRWIVVKLISFGFGKDRNSSIAILALSSLTAEEKLLSITAIFEEFFYKAKKSFSMYIKSTTYIESITEYLLTNPDLEDYSDFLHDSSKSFMNMFNTKLLEFTYSTFPLVATLDYDGYILYQEFLSKQIDSFQEHIYNNFIESLIGLNASKILDSVDEEFNN
jgi:hypothetical protein